MTSRDVDALLDLVNEKNRVIAALIDLIPAHLLASIPELSAPTPEVEP